MAVPARISFTVRSILDLPENDSDSAAHLLPLHSLSGSPYSSWTDSDRGHCMCKLCLSQKKGKQREIFLIARVDQLCHIFPP